MKKKLKSSKIILKGSDMRPRDLVHYDHIIHRSGTGVHKSEKTYSRKVKHKREDVFFLYIY